MSSSRAPLSLLLALLLLALVLVAGQGRAAPDPGESMFLLRWEDSYPFYRQWAQEKERAAVQKRDDFPLEGLLMEGLLRSHTHEHSGRRELLHSPEKVYTLDRINAAWLQRAVAFYRQGKWDATRDALDRLASPMRSDHRNQLRFLRGNLQMRAGDDGAAQASFAGITPDSPLWPLAQYNRALMQLRHSRLEETAGSLSLLEEWLDDQKSTPPLADRLRLLDARLQARRGDQRGALRQLHRIEAGHPLYPLARHSEVDLNHQAGDDVGALPALLELSLQPDGTLLAYHQVALLNTLERLGASRQVLVLGERILPSLLDSLDQAHTLALQVSSERFFQQLLDGTLDAEGTRVQQRLSRQTTLLVAEVRRLASLRQLLRRTLELLPAYEPMFGKGIGHLGALMDLHPALKPLKIYQLPGEVAQTGHAGFEQDLSDLVGQPAPWDQRYEIFRGMSIWEKGRPAWLAGGRIDQLGAAGDLGQMVEERHKMVRRLSRRQVEESAIHMQHLGQRAQAMLKQLDTLDEALRPRLRDRLQREARRITRGIEQEVLWLAGRTLLKPTEIDNPGPQPRYNLSVSGDGRVSVSTLESPPSVPPSPNAFAALELLGERALNGEVRTRALRHLADLHLASAERRMLTGEADSSGFMGSFERASAYYQQLFDHPGSSPADPVVLLYQLAHAYSLEGRPEDALRMLERLDSAYPGHPDADETLFRIAETRFSLGDYEQAARRYGALLAQWPTSPLISKARHKLGWSQFKLGEYQLALDQSLPLLETHWQGQGQGGVQEEQGQQAKDQPLVEDLLRLSAMSFTHLGGIERLRARFGAQAPSLFEQALLEQLAAYMEEKERFSDAAGTYDELLARFPTSRAAPDYQAGLVRVHVQGGFATLAWPAREAFVERFGVDSPYWRQADDEVRRHISGYLADYLPLLAQRDHALAQESGVSDDYTRPLHWYRHFILALPEHPQVARMRFMRGEALTELGMHREAAEAYARAGYDYPEFEQRTEAAYAELLAYQHLHEAGEGPQKTSWLARGILRSRHFIDTYPGAEQTPEVLTKLAEDLLIQDDDTQALAVARRLTGDEALTDPALALRLWRVLAHSAFNLEQYAQAEEGYRKARELEPPAPEARAFTLRLAESIFKQGEQARDEGRHSQAIEHFLRLREAVPDSTVLPQAEFEAARLLMESQRWEEAIVQLESFRHRYADHPLSATIPDKLVIAFENTRAWDRAANELQRIFEREVEREGDTPLARDALWRSASLQEKAGDPLRATLGYEHYIKAFPDPLDTRLEAYVQLLRLAGDPAVNRDPDTLRQALIDAHEQAGEQATARSRFLASEASLALAQQAKAEYDRIALTLPLDRSLARKKAAMERSIAGLTRTTGYGLAEHATAATSLIGEIYAELARALMGSERPTELDELALEQYDILLEEEAIPFEEKAIDLHEMNLDRIQQGVFTPAMAQSLKKLRQLMPARYDKTEVVDEIIDKMQ